MLVLFLDPYHLGDPLFLTGLARDLKARSGGAVLVHGTGERGERAVEGLGHVAVSERGVWRTRDPEAAGAIEHAGRDLNREIVHELNEAGVASVRVIGADRGLLRLDGDHLGVGRTGWIAELVRQGVVVVVASFTDQEAPSLREVDAAGAAAVLAEDLGTAVAVLLTAGIDGRPSVSWDDVSGSLPDAASVRRLMDSGASVVVLDRAAFRAGEGGIPVQGNTAAP